MTVSVYRSVASPCPASVTVCGMVGSLLSAVLVILLGAFTVVIVLVLATLLLTWLVTVLVQNLRALPIRLVGR